MSRPTLWHIPISHYSEKVRWALEFKGVDHRRHAPPPGGHIPVALVLTRGRSVTFPVLTLDGRHVGDSTAIIAALEERFPSPPLYPGDPVARARALALEDYFDERAGPAVRQAGFHAFRGDEARLRQAAARNAPAPLARLGPVLGAYARVYTALRWNARDDEAARRSHAAIGEVLDRLEAELGGRDYLVGDAFGVADLTAAALLYPFALPPGAPMGPDMMAPALARLRNELGGPDRPALQWVETIYARHRRRPAGTDGGH